MKNLNNLNAKSILSALFLSLIISISLVAQPSEYIADESEMDLTVETWMTDLNSFDNDESEMVIEDWMTDLNSFYYEEAELLVVEDWMTDLESFNIGEDYSMEVELWMTSLDEFYCIESFLLADADEAVLEIEEWMTDLTAYGKVSASEIEGIKDIDFSSDEVILVALK
ncbi:hypothetical protein [Carboxylicivirga sp. M1479]|uniref:hypothetical protein n=1 Tax=Carboxylicivirga sp. M1479 TaxID=2594476 RepID=UPI0011786BD0|nr:hypothetical protein [Carboxylicivirga sp. M1479]TRX66500.1 hypothetical protein FNN09_13385 [Carboxylicivirga sp. M1479]